MKNVPDQVSHEISRIRGISSERLQEILKKISKAYPFEIKNDAELHLLAYQKKIIRHVENILASLADKDFKGCYAIVGDAESGKTQFGYVLLYMAKKIYGLRTLMISANDLVFSREALRAILDKSKLIIIDDIDHFLRPGINRSILSQIFSEITKLAENHCIIILLRRSSWYSLQKIFGVEKTKNIITVIYDIVLSRNELFKLVPEITVRFVAMNILVNETTSLSSKSPMFIRNVISFCRDVCSDLIRNNTINSIRKLLLILSNLYKFSIHEITREKIPRARALEKAVNESLLGVLADVLERLAGILSISDKTVNVQVSMLDKRKIMVKVDNQALDVTVQPLRYRGDTDFQNQVLFEKNVLMIILYEGEEYYKALIEFLKLFVKALREKDSFLVPSIISYRVARYISIINPETQKYLLLRWQKLGEKLLECLKLIVLNYSLEKETSLERKLLLLSDFVFSILRLINHRIQYNLLKDLLVTVMDRYLVPSFEKTRPDIMGSLTDSIFRILENGRIIKWYPGAPSVIIDKRILSQIKNLTKIREKLVKELSFRLRFAL
ncbi:MAG: hypothetical protein ACTSX9_07475 [Candidatus Njordarchaeales archaeon]